MEAKGLEMNILNQLDKERRPRNPPLIVNLKRNSSIESIHRVHAVICDSKGRVLMCAGNQEHETFVRSALKPFQILPFISSGTSEKVDCSEKGLAVCCGSHSGSAYHAREVFRLLWNSHIDVNELQCPVPKGRKSPLEHNCSGKHAAFLATCKKLGWPLNNYLQGEHPLQIEISRRIADLLGLPSEELLAARDDCGAPTFFLRLSQIALLYATLSGSTQAELEQVSRAMLAYPELVAGKGRFDTEIMGRGHEQIISKGGAEGIQCIGRKGQGIGIAIKVEDGSKRAKHAVALHLIRQLEWMTPSGLEELEEKFLLLGPGVQLEVQGLLRFQET